MAANADGAALRSSTSVYSLFTLGHNYVDSAQPADYTGAVIVRAAFLTLVRAAARVAVAHADLAVLGARRRP